MARKNRGTRAEAKTAPKAATTAPQQAAKEEPSPAPAGPIDVPEEQQILGAELGAVDAQARIEELVASNAELRRQIEATRAHAEELAAIKESLAKEVDDFQDHSWRRELCGELEALKQDLAELHGEEYEEIPDTIMGPDAHPSQAEALVAAWRQLQAAAMEENVELAEEEYPYEAVSRMQAHLEDELSVVIEHLQAIKAQSTAVTMHKAQLENELKEMIEARKKAAAAAASQPGKAPDSVAAALAPAIVAGPDGKASDA